MLRALEVNLNQDIERIVKLTRVLIDTQVTVAEMLAHLQLLSKPLPLMFQEKVNFCHTV